METFKEGDTVQLKSGGPKMTIKEIHEGGSLTCQWFSGTKLQTGYFKPHSLNLVKDE